MNGSAAYRALHVQLAGAVEALPMEHMPAAQRPHVVRQFLTADRAAMHMVCGACASRLQSRGAACVPMLAGSCMQHLSHSGRVLGPLFNYCREGVAGRLRDGEVVLAVHCDHCRSTCMHASSVSRHCSALVLERGCWGPRLALLTHIGEILQPNIDSSPVAVEAHPRTRHRSCRSPPPAPTDAP